MFADNTDFAGDLHKEHTPEAIRQRLQEGPKHSYLRDFVYGAIDGAVTTFAVVAGVTGANLSGGVVVVLGAANLIADGFSMAASSFLATRAEHHHRNRLRRMEEMHVALLPEGEREEIRQIFAAKGFQGEDLERVVSVITADVEQWVDTMMKEELGLVLDSPSPWRTAFATFAAFIVIGAIPLLAYVYLMLVPGGLTRPFWWSAALTGAAFFLVGTWKSRFVERPWYAGGLETLAVGGLAATLAYYTGVFLRHVVQ
ncbi:MAG: membrane protein [Gemmatales bacterium]|nr:MAG: membrane protein [Gemmatales bacterium]